MEEDNINYYEKAKNIARQFTKCLFSQKLRLKDISKKDIQNIC
jgi:exonuclease VII small subunit